MQVIGDLNSLIIGSSRGTSTISLQAGEIVSAFVKDVTNQEALLLIRGQSIPARLEAPLQPGQRVSLRVQEIGENRIVFQQVREAGIRMSPRGFQPSPGEIFLQRHGMPLTNGNLLLAEALIAAGKENVSPEELTLLSRILGSNPTPSQVEGLVHLFTRGQPFQSSHVLPMENVMDAFAGNLIPDLKLTGDNQLLIQALMTMAGGKELLEGLTISLGEDNIAHKLSQLQEKLGLDHEMRMETLVKEGKPLETRELPSAKESLLSLLGGEGKLSPEATNQARTLLSIITGLQLLHGGQTEQGQVFLMGWLNWGGENQDQSPFFLSFFQNEKGGQGPGEPTRQVMIKTNTPSLGSILANVRIYGDYLSVEIGVEKPETQKVFNQYKNKLAEMLADLPWRIQILPCRLQTGEKKEEIRFKNFAQPANHQRVDIRL